MTELNNFSDDQVQVLKTLVAMIIPASAEHGVPGADDDAIFADILTAAAGRHDHVTDLLARLDELSRNFQGAEFGSLPRPRQDEIIPVFRESCAGDAELLETLAAQCYYRDDRVLQALNLELRPPFPQGHEVEQGDWSLLDSVRGRPEMFKTIP
jgi:hypothetical protein